MRLVCVCSRTGDIDPIGLSSTITTNQSSKRKFGVSHLGFLLLGSRALRLQLGLQPLHRRRLLLSATTALLRGIASCLRWLGARLLLRPCRRAAGRLAAPLRGGRGIDER